MRKEDFWLNLPKIFIEATFLPMEVAFNFFTGLANILKKHFLQNLKR